MHVVKRTKQPPPGLLPPAAPAVHYATGADGGGNITGWAADRQQAKAFGDDEAQAVLACYAGRHDAGSVDVEPVLVLTTDEVREVVGVRGLKVPPGGEDMSSVNQMHRQIRDAAEPQPEQKPQPKPELKKRVR